MQHEITLNRLEDAVKLNNLAHEHDGKLIVSCGSIMVDARSFFALIALIGRKNINLIAPDHEDPMNFLNFLKKIN